MIFLNHKTWLTNILVFSFLFSTSLIFDFKNAHGILAQNKIGNYFLFYAGAILGGISLMILCNFFNNIFLTKSVYKRIFAFFQYMSKNALPILGTHVFIIIIMDLVIKRTAILNPNQGFVLKVLIITTLTFYLIVPFLYDKFYFIFGIEKPNSKSIK